MIVNVTNGDFDTMQTAPSGPISVQTQILRTPVEQYEFRLHCLIGSASGLI